MNKFLYIASAGSGKTWGICQHSLSNLGSKYSLLLSYTNQGKLALEEEIKKQNSGILHPNIRVMTWYSFLLQECIKPYQSYITSINSIKSISFDNRNSINYFSSTDKKHYIDIDDNVKSNYASKLLMEINRLSNGKLIKRLEEVYCWIYIDEVQDLAGWDLQFIEALIKSHIGIYLVGDPKQSTFKTNTGTKNKNYSGKNILSFFNDMIKSKQIQLIENNETKRFNCIISELANLIDDTKPQVISSIEPNDMFDGVFIIEKKNISLYSRHFDAQCLRYDKRTTVEYDSPLNYGASKGRTFDRVIIYPNDKLKNFLENGAQLKSPEKYYIAVTRARKQIVFVYEKFPNKLALPFKKITYKGSNGDDIFNLLRWVPSSRK